MFHQKFFNKYEDRIAGEGAGKACVSFVSSEDGAATSLIEKAKMKDQSFCVSLVFRADIKSPEFIAIMRLSDEVHRAQYAEQPLPYDSVTIKDYQERPLYAGREAVGRILEITLQGPYHDIASFLGYYGLYTRAAFGKKYPSYESQLSRVIKREDKVTIDEGDYIALMEHLPKSLPSGLKVAVLRSPSSWRVRVLGLSCCIKVSVEETVAGIKEMLTYDTLLPEKVRASLSGMMR